MKDVLFEVGLEELPARLIDDTERQFVVKTEEWLNDLRINYKSITSYSTPRRIAILIEELNEKQTTIEEEIKGPAMKIAKDNDGNWTKAATGFSRGQGKSTDDIYTKDVKGTTYIYVKKHIEGKQSKELLPSFKKIIESIHFDKNMRWGSETLRYARPIRWLVALYGTEVIPFEVASVKTDNITFGHRFLGNQFIISEPNSYETLLEKQYVIPNPRKREKLIVKGIQEIENEHEYVVHMDQSLLNEVCNLVEYPTVFVGSFEQNFLNLPPEVLITSMQEHQRYFPVHGNNGKLLPRFIGVRNGDDKAIDKVIRGNEKVLHARLSDAQFFYDEDQKNSIGFYQKKLERVVFQEKLGTISDKIERMKTITEEIAQQLNLNDRVRENAVHATTISKFDLMTNMVNEFTELQGVIGEKYALKFGETEAVAKAIKEHYLPNSAKGPLPKSIEGSIVSIADKLDTVVGCISVGLRPTGSQDPYGLRRQAIGILRILQDNDWPISMNTLVRIASQIHQNKESRGELMEEVLEFFRQRAAFLLKDLSIESDIIEAVLDKEIGIFSYTVEKAKVLSNKRNDLEFKPVQEALVRVLNLAMKAEEEEINPVHFQSKSESYLYQIYKEVQVTYKQEKEKGRANEALQQLSILANPIHDFFEENMVMDKDDKIRANRLSLIKQIADLVCDYANLSIIEWKQQF